MTILPITASRHALLVTASWRRLERLYTQADRYVGKLQVHCMDCRVSHNKCCGQKSHLLAEKGPRCWLM